MPSIYLKIKEEHEVEEFAGQLKGLVKTVNPFVCILEERKGFTIQNRVIEMFDFISSGVDGHLYNMMCFIPFSSGTLHAVFNCLNKDSEDWKEIAWQAILTLEEETKRIQAEHEWTPSYFSYKDDEINQNAIV